MALLATLMSWVRPRHSRQDEQSKHCPTFLIKKKCRMSDSGKNDEKDHQRQIMIRKSLQSRASSRATDRVPDEFLNDHSDDDEEEEERNPSLKKDWKAYEADIQRNRSTLMRSHPGVKRPTAQSRAGSSSSKRPPPYSFGSSSTSPRSPTLSSTPESPASAEIGRAF
ncbi:hypothetical protein FZEAL_1290 [Fusarium zealandicum]|uniref:Uncharacterized protein n=1 Tax=Fusarium zealandicum TaxID=1053134 RepID=A0A8H4XQ27_9HYPO|nr:hypothetical protein FZEAL_1290 [Fusarium zealandicum]